MVQGEAARTAGCESIVKGDGDMKQANSPAEGVAAMSEAKPQENDPKKPAS